MGLMKTLHLVTMWLMAGGSWCLGATPGLKTETFDRDPGWEGHNNRIVPEKPLIVTQDFGYSATNHAGKSAGEVGGTIQRSTTPAYYAAEIPTRTLDDKFTASGSFALTKSQPGAGIFFGFFNSQQPGGSGRPIGSLGLDFDFEGSGGRLAVRLITNTNKSSGTFITPYLPGKFRPTPIKNDGTRYHWTLAYDPHAAGGNGQFVFTMRSDSHTKQDYGSLPEASQKEALARFPNTTTFTVDLTPGYKKEGATYDRFGVLNMMKSGGIASMYFDDVVIDGRPEDFSKEPKWIAMGNRKTYEDREVVGAHDFGFSEKTNHAGGARAGEVGGGLWRSGDYGYYGDHVGPLDLNQKLEARGKAKMVTAGPDSDMHIGWFSSATKDKSPDEAGNFIGIHVGGPTRIGHYFIPQFATAKGTKGKVDKGPIITPGKLFDWSLVYDPAASNGNGEMRVTLGTETVTLALKPGQKAEGAMLDRFGLFTSQAGGQMVKIFLDDVSYTTGGNVAPPSSAAILEGHQGSVLSVEFSEDGRTLVSGSRDGTIKIWDVPSRKLTRTLTGHGLNVFGVTFSPKGDLLASCGGDKMIRLWDARTLEPVRVLQGHTDAIRAVAFSPDQVALASVSLDQTVRLWDVATGKLTHTLKGHTARVKSVVYGLNGRGIATAASDKTIRLWDTKTGAQQATLGGHTKDIETLALSPDGKTLASSSGDTTVWLWDLAAKKHVATLEGHGAEVDSVAFSPDGRIIASGSKDKLIKLWDAVSRRMLRTIEGHTGRVESLAFSPDGKTIASGGGGGDTSIRLWKIEAGTASGEVR
jgi:WD40 repeat protein